MPASTLALQGVVEYYAPVIPRDSKFITTEDVVKADLDVQKYKIECVDLIDTVGYANPDKTVIVTRHEGTVDYIKSNMNWASWGETLTPKVLDGNVTVDDIKGKQVIGTLPPHLVSECDYYISVSIKDFDYAVDNDLKGEELENRIVISDPIKLEKIDIVVHWVTSAVIGCDYYYGESEHSIFDNTADLLQHLNCKANTSGGFSLGYLNYSNSEGAVFGYEFTDQISIESVISKIKNRLSIKVSEDYITNLEYIELYKLLKNSNSIIENRVKRLFSKRNKLDELVDYLMDCDGGYVRLLSEPTLDQQLKAIEKDGLNVRYIQSPEKTVIFKALESKENVMSQWGIIKSLKNVNEDVAREIFRNFICEDSYKLLKNPSQTERLMLIKEYPHMIKKIGNPTKKEVVLAISLKSDLIEEIAHTPQEAQNIAIERGYSLLRIKNPTAETIQKAVEINGHNLRHVDEHVVTEELKLKAIETSETIIRWIKNPTDEMIKKHYEYWLKSQD